MKSERRVALVIGNGDYRNFEPLPNPSNDAKRMASALRRAGFDVILERDATLASMTQALERFSEAMQTADISLFYFAGHAVQIDWRNYILPISAELSAEGDAVSGLVGQVAAQTLDLADVLDRMERADNQLNVIVLDACRNNPFTIEAREATRALSRATGKTPFTVGVGLAQAFAPPRTFLAYSTAPGQVARDGSGSNSPYTGALVDALTLPARKLEDVFKIVRTQVAATTNNEQIPWDNSSVFDDFYFQIPSSPEAALAADEDGEINTIFVSP